MRRPRAGAIQAAARAILPAARAGRARRILPAAVAALAGAGLAALLASATNGCSNKDAVLGVEQIVNPPVGGVSLSRDVQPIFDRSCNFSGCHGSSPGVDLSLLSGDSHAALVNVQSCEASTFLRVFPGSSILSYLIIKLQGTQNTLASCQPCLLTGGTTVSNCGVSMPFGGSPLGGPEIQLISDWIDQGAADN